MIQFFLSFISSLDPPIVFNVNSRTLKVTWEAPSEMNGILEKYILHKNDAFLAEIPAGNETEYVVEQLTPFSSYKFRFVS